MRHRARCRIDPDKDGDIGRVEFDNDKLQFKVGDFIVADITPKPAPPAADTTKVKPDATTATEQPVATAEKVPPTSTATELPAADVTPKETTTTNQLDQQPTTTDTQPTATRKRRKSTVDNFFGNDDFFADFGA